MIKKNRLGLLVLAISTAVLLSGCSQDAYSGFFGFMSGNVYSDDLGLTLPGQSSAGAAVATENATTSTQKPVTLNGSDSGEADDVEKAAGENVETENADGTTSSVSSNGDGTATKAGVKVVIEKKLNSVDLEGLFGGTNVVNPKVVAISGKALAGTDALSNVNKVIANTAAGDKKVVGLVGSDGQFKVPMFTPGTEKENKELEEFYSTKNKQAKAEISKMLKEKEQDPEKVLAAFNTLVSMENKIENFKTKISGATFADNDEKEKFNKIANSFKIPEFDAEPTKEEVLNVKLFFNIVEGFTDAINALNSSNGAFSGTSKGTAAVEIDVDKFTEILGLIKTAMSVKLVDNGIDDLISKLDTGSLYSSLSAASGDDSTDLIDTLLNNNSAFMKSLLNDYLGISKKSNGKYEYSSSISEERIGKLVNILNLIDMSQYIISLAGTDQEILDKFNAAQSTGAVGLDGLINYTLSFLITNIDDTFEGLFDYYSQNHGTATSYATKTLLINAYLANHTNEIDAIFDKSIEVDFEKFVENSSGGDDPIIAVFKDGDEFDFDEILNDIFSFSGGKFVEIHNFFDTSISLVSSDGNLDMVKDALSGGLEELEKFETEYSQRP